MIKQKDLLIPDKTETPENHGQKDREENKNRGACLHGMFFDRTYDYDRLNLD
jgi:hypothetical protein